MLPIFGRQLLTGARMLLVLTLVLGLAYPLAMVAIGRLMPAQDASIRNSAGEVVGNAHLAQPVSGDDWFFPRPSAGDYDGLASGASNLAANSPELLRQISDRRSQIATREHVDPASIPADALTASASGLDPDISPEYARLQIPRVARETGLSRKDVTAMVQANTQNPLLGFIGEPQVNVVTLNNDLANGSGAHVETDASAPTYSAPAGTASAVSAGGR
ncbi:potassium-transporting ATPase subunit C [Brevibacterium oceani]|uniref:potassium-transporting ATPase subunit C n=1 Tax=Brevibacterium oceani TaxID=358099 RepID=UPI0015E65723|nr:potassium-transporting ATPase subunit C [Brevibacterium oceani]